ncbi:hypothetical protein FS749_011792 [Ceratobasidium sp. UAMH 11750]|nr:hypothetical protein FS749_011792 [Ceratobasidium sp. UAMH 11750]
MWVKCMKDATKVAVKCARHKPQDHGDGKDLKRVAREIHAWSKCDHKNVLALFGLAQHRGRLAIISPWMENGTLPEYVAKRPEVDRLDLCLQITEGLEYLHKGDMIHGDLKGSNILVSEDGVPKLADFGNTKLGQQSARFTTGTDTTGTGVMCTLRWAAPEIMRNSSRSTQADVYALGMTILETVTGAVPYEDKADLAVLVEVLVQQRFPLRYDDSMKVQGDKNRLWDLMTKCWNHDSACRPEAPQIKEELASILASASFIEGEKLSFVQFCSRQYRGHIRQVARCRMPGMQEYILVEVEQSLISTPTGCICIRLERESSLGTRSRRTRDALWLNSYVDTATISGDIEALRPTNDVILERLTTEAPDRHEPPHEATLSFERDRTVKEVQLLDFLPSNHPLHERIR